MHNVTCTKIKAVEYNMYNVQCQYILVKVPCECITANIARGCGREPIKHEAQPKAAHMLLIVHIYVTQYHNYMYMYIQNCHAIP